MSQKFYFEASDGNHKFTPRFEASGGAGKPLKPATTTTLGGIIVGEDLEITEEGVLSVATTDVVEEDNTSPVTSEAVHTAIEGVLPDVNSSDNGKVLSVVNGEWEKADADFLPKVTPSDNGKLLGVVEGEWDKVTPEDELPSVTASDNGKVLGVVNGAWDKVTPEEELPAVTASDDGKVLGVVNGAWNKVTPEEELPSVTSSDNGKVLGVVNGAWDKVTPEKELPTVTASDNGKVLEVANGAWNKVTPEKELPTVTSSDNGKVLGVSNGAWNKVTPEKELPSVTSTDNGKVLEVVNGAWDKVTPEGALPSVTASDDGKVLGVVNGAWDKTTPEKELPSVTSTDNGEVLGVVNGAWDKVTPEKELPSVTASDNGEVLGVVNGTWGKMALPSVEENTFIVTVTVTYDNTDPNNEQTILTPDKTESEMTAAFRAGKFVVAIFSFPGYDYNTYDLPCVNYSIQEWEDNEFSVYAEFCRVFPVPAPTTGSYGRYEIAMNRKTGYFRYYHPADSDTEYEPSVTWEYNGDNFSAEKYDRTYQKCNITWDSAQNKFVPSLNFSSVTASGKLGSGTNSAAFNFTVIEGAKRYPVICYGLERISNINTILLYAVNMTHTDDPTTPLPDNFEIRLYKWTSEANITYCGSKTISALPPVTASDNGKILGVVNGAWSKVTPEQELPSVTSTDNGDLLSVVNGQWSKSDPPYTKTGSVVTPSQDFMDAVLASLPIYNGTVV